MTWLYRSTFTTLENVIYQLALSTSSDTTLSSDIQTLVSTTYANHKQWLLSLIYEESNYLATVLDRTFVPFKFTQTMRYREYQKWFDRDKDLGLTVIRLPYDLLSVDSITFITTALTSSQYYLRDEARYPAYEIAIDGDANVSVPSSFTETISIVGEWGYHTNPSAMWVDSLDTVQDGSGINASVTSLTVTDADAIGADGFTRFQTLQYIRIDDEYLQITAINTSTQVLTVKRGQLGTTAASHDNEAQIDVYVPDDLITQAVRRLVVQRFLNPSEQRVIQTTPEGGTIQIGNETIHLPPKRYTFGSV